MLRNKSIKKLFYYLNLIFLCGCTAIQPPHDFVYKETSTDSFTIASWQKLTSPTAAYKIYIEGDGHAFDRHGFPTADPTPKDEMMRKLAYGDNSPNVIYLARPCQYVKSAFCSTKYWTTARFAPEVIKAEYQTIRKITGNNPVVLIGFSGGAQIAELLAAITDLNIAKIITIAGNLDHAAWTSYHQLPALSDSLNAADYKSRLANIPQIHYIGTKDKVVPPELIRPLVNKNRLIEIQGATHNKGWEQIYHLIRQE